jgi:polyisoprenyl-teichoic acid--peptidoglycan teichoic acid transferase
MKVLNGVETVTRAQRRRWRRRRSLRRLMVVAVLVTLCFAAGIHAGVLEEGSDSGAGHSARVAGTVHPPGVESEVGRESGLLVAEKARLLASRTAQGLVAARSGGPTQDEPADKQVSEEAQDGAEEHLDVLVLGVDRRPSASEGATSHSDTMMLVRVSPQTGQIRLLSVPRDLLVEVEPGVQDRINTAYLAGGTPLATEVMEELTSVTIDRYAIVDFGGFEDSIDAVGGVTLEVEQPIRIGLDGHRVYVAPGRQELDGLEALAYARYRDTTCGDLDRMKRQQRLVAALREEVLGWNTITRLPDIVRVMRDNVDTNLGVVQAISVGRALVGNGKVGGMRSYQLKGKPEILPNGDAVLVPDEQANERILEKFRGDGPARDSGQAETQPSKDSSSGC